MCAKHDEPYHIFYGHPYIFQKFLEGFAPAELVQAIDFNTLRREDVKSSDQELKRHVGDLLFSFNLTNGKPAWVIILLEVQRRNDQLMAARLMEYTLLFWKRALHEARLVNGKLPAVLAIVLYNGKDRWKAPMDLHGCIDLLPARRGWLGHPTCAMRWSIFQRWICKLSARKIILSVGLWN